MTPEQRALAAAFLADKAFHEKFWSQVDLRSPDECWEWTGTRKPPWGYGHVHLGGGKSTTASRVALTLSLGRTLGVYEWACHHCDNPPCCNPGHLFVGSPSDNSVDCVDKGRANRARGSRHRDAKLTEEQVREIRAWPSYAGHQYDMADRYGVSSQTISGIRRGRTWRHVS